MRDRTVRTRISVHTQHAAPRWWGTGRTEAGGLQGGGGAGGPGRTAPHFDFVSYIFTLTERASLSYLVRKTALSTGELLLLWLCSPPCRPLPLPIPLILDPRHCCVRELLYGPALARLEPPGRVAVTRSPRAIALRAPGLPARPEPPLVEHLGAAAREVLDRWW